MKIILKNIDKSYDRKVIDDLSYEFKSGKLYVIKGVSGCGKTTLLNIIGGIEKEYAGEVIVEEGKIRIGYVFQSSLLLSKLTIMENLLFIKNDIEEITRLAKIFSVDDLLEKYPDNLSGGERQRVAVIRALLLKPNTLLADEPTASLDEYNSMQMSKIIASLKNEGRIVLVATHEQYFDEYADEIINLNYGRINGD